MRLSLPFKSRTRSTSSSVDSATPVRQEKAKKSKTRVNVAMIQRVRRGDTREVLELAEVLKTGTIFWEKIHKADKGGKEDLFWIVQRGGSCSQNIFILPGTEKGKLPKKREVGLG